MRVFIQEIVMSPRILTCALPVLLNAHDPLSRPWFDNRPYLLYDGAHYCCERGLELSRE